jgi:hypothetical protein
MHFFIKNLAVAGTNYHETLFNLFIWRQGIALTCSREDKVLPLTCSFTSRLGLFKTFMEMSPLPVKGLQNFGLCSALRAFEQGGFFILQHLLWHGSRFFRFHPKDRPIQSLLTTHMGMWRTYSNSNPILTSSHSVASCDTNARGCWGLILTWCADNVFPLTC